MPNEGRETIGSSDGGNDALVLRRPETMRSEGGVRAALASGITNILPVMAPQNLYTLLSYIMSVHRYLCTYDCKII